MKARDFETLVLPFKDKLYRLARRLLVSHEEAQDAVQEVLIKLWNNKRQIAGYRSAEAFAMTTTRNFCLDRLKSKQAANLRLVHTNYEQKRSLEKQVEARDSVGLVFELIKELPEQQRSVLQLRDVEGYEYDEIANILEMNPTAVRVNLSRARKILREQLIKTHAHGIAKP